MRKLLLVLAMLFVSVVASAQVVNPKTLEFTSSVDHASVIRYDLEIWLVGASAPMMTVSLGKPAIAASSQVIVTPSALVGLPPGNYTVTVASVGAEGMMRSEPPFPFRREGIPRAPVGVILR